MFGGFISGNTNFLIPEIGTPATENIKHPAMWEFQVCTSIFHIFLV